MNITWKGQKGMNITWYIKKYFLHQLFKLINLGSNPHVYSNQRKQDGEIYGEYCLDNIYITMVCFSTNKVLKNLIVLVISYMTGNLEREILDRFDKRHF